MRFPPSFWYLSKVNLIISNTLKNIYYFQQKLLKYNIIIRHWIFLVAQMVKCLPTMRETWVQSLGRKDLLETGVATHSSILAWKSRGQRNLVRLQSMGSQRVGHDFTHSLMYWMGFSSGSIGKESMCNAGGLGSIPGLGRFPGGGQCNPLQYSCLENAHGQKSLAGYSAWGCRVRQDRATKHNTCVR